MQRIFRTLAIMVCALPGLVACQSGEKILADMMAGETPVEAFAPTVASSRLIFVVPVDGMPGPARLVLADAVAASLRDANKPAIIAEKVNELGPTIAGRIVEVKERGTVAWVTMVWELRAPYGTAVAEYRQQVVVDSGLWKSGSAEAVNVLVFDAAPKIVGMVHDFVSPMAEAAPQETIIQAPAPVPVQAAVAAPIPAPKPAANLTPVKAAAKEPPAPNQAGQNQQTVAALTQQPPRPEKKKAKTPPNKRIGNPLVLKNMSSAVKQKSSSGSAASGKKGTKKDKPVLMPVPKKGPSRLAAAPPPVGWGRPAFPIKPVLGAPGDGNKALTLAMKKALRRNDLTVTEDPRQAGFVIQGRVEVSAPVNGLQQARIVWSVKTMDGDEVGKAVQENAVKAGSLNGSWGRVAEIVSSAAITGIQELFGIEKKQSFRRKKEPKFSGRTDVPRVPGRALPPPR